MSEVVRFRSAGALALKGRLDDAARQLIDALGCEAGHRIGWLARFGALDDAERHLMLALEKEIERRQGFGWFFAEDEGTAEAAKLLAQATSDTSADAGP